MAAPILPMGVGARPSFTAGDRIFLGEGLFETIKIDQGQPCYSEWHRQRMSQGALSLSIPFEVSSQCWHEQLINCIQVADIKHGGIKVILSGKNAPRGLEAMSDVSSLLFEAFTYTHTEEALQLVSAPWLRDAKNPIYQFKSVNYLESILARRHALASGADDALFFNQAYQATETTVANLFLIKEERVLTPMLTNGVLNGIIRGRVLRLCSDFGIGATELAIDARTIVTADAVFVTNALQGIRSVKSFDGHAVAVHHPLVSNLRDLLASDSKRWDN